MTHNKNNIPIRFFAADFQLDPVEEVEVSLETFKRLTGEITKERHTVFENGCSQICYTIENESGEELPEFNP
jgi:hypothetical protein